MVMEKEKKRKFKTNKILVLAEDPACFLQFTEVTTVGLLVQESSYADFLSHVWKWFWARWS